MADAIIKSIHQYSYKKVLIYPVVAILLTPLLVAVPTHATHDGGGASLFIAPSSSDVTVGDTFEVSVLLDTNDHIINTIDAYLKFSPDKLQVVAPSIGKSIIGIWTAPPSFNNSSGEMHFQGGIPSPGINTSRGLITTITFRARSVGTANVSFLGESKILLNDGQGTDILTEIHGGSYRLGLPLPQGPIVTSPTHPDQDKWHRAQTAVLQWTTEYPSIQGYSYVLNNEPIDEPDNISEGINPEVSYKNLSGGLHYFHIKALRNGNWGGTTHFALKVDATPPADFTIDILPKPKTTSRFPVIDFRTTDSLSGMSHYELRIVSLDLADFESTSERNNEGFFIEVENRYVPDAELDIGEYDVIVRAFDNAGNIRESTERMRIVNPTVTFSRSGVNVLNRFTIPWFILILAGLLLLALFIILLVLAIRNHRDVSAERVKGALEDPVIKRRLEELQKRKQKHNDLKQKMAAFILIATAALFAVPTARINAQEVISLPPPIITTISTDISNDQLFYVGGQTDVADSEVIIFLQNLQDGQVTSDTVSTDRKGDWFYARQEPLLKGSYLLWAQSRIGSQNSPPSPQNRINVSQTALQLGASRLSFETLYLLTASILFGIVVVLGSFISYYLFHGRRNRKELMHEIKEAEDVIKEGFVTLHEDIAAELDIIHQARLSKVLSVQQEDRERRLLEDFDEVETFIKKEFQDVKLRAKTV